MVQGQPMKDDSGSPATFGQNLDELERIVRRLETDTHLPLEEAIDLYERGLHLSKQCRERLTSARQRLTEIDASQEDADNLDDEPGDDGS